MCVCYLDDVAVDGHLDHVEGKVLAAALVAEAQVAAQTFHVHLSAIQVEMKIIIPSSGENKQPIVARRENRSNTGRHPRAKINNQSASGENEQQTNQSARSRPLGVAKDKIGN